jgi:hypothetical protein
VVHLYCLRCNHANDGDARYCSACGAGLIRVICPQCRAMNSAESHFCQSCGAALPEPAVLKSMHPAPPAPPAAEIPSLDDVVAMPASVPALAVASSALPVMTATAWVPPEPPQLLPAQRLQGESLPGPRPRTAMLSPAQLAVLVLALGAAMALAASMMLWPGGDTPEVARAGIGSPPVGSTPSSAMPAVDVGGDRAMPGAATIAPAAAVSATAAEPAAATKPLPAVARPRPPKPAAQPSATVHECTPEVHALSLCAPGAAVIRRP